MKTAYMLCSLGSLAGFLVGAGCWGVAGGHCGNLEGDDTCAERGGGAYCDTCRTENDGCSEILPPEDCHFANSGLEIATSIAGDTANTASPLDTSNSTLPEDTTHTTSEWTTVALTGASDGTTGAPECVNDAECDGSTPFCGASGHCVSTCSEAMEPNDACAQQSPDFPACANGSCVSCEHALMLVVPILGACAPCTEHFQCVSGACDIFEGTCFDPERVVEVGGGGGRPDTIAEALEVYNGMVDRRGERRVVIVMQHRGELGDTDFDESVSITAASHDAVAFVAGSVFPNWTNVDVNSPTLTVEGVATRTYLDGVRILNDTSTSAGQSLRCNDARVDIRRSRLVENLGGGIVALGQCELVVQNSFIGVNPDESDADGIDAVLIADANVKASILYSTLGAGPGHGASALSCTAVADVVVRNSLLVSLASTPEVACPGAVLMANATEDGLGDMDEGWFVNYNVGNLHLSPTGDFLIHLIVANPQLGDPVTDIDGALRILDYVGADHP